MRTAFRPRDWLIPTTSTRGTPVKMNADAVRHAGRRLSSSRRTAVGRHPAAGRQLEPRRPEPLPAPVTEDFKSSETVVTL
jgi:hypothetical protein